MNKKYKPLVYICSPLSGDIKQNQHKAKVYAYYAYQQGCIPITPHLMFPFLDDMNENHRSDALFMDIVLLGKCDELWVFGQKITPGMKEEIEIAKRRRQPIKYFEERIMGGRR